MEEALRDAEHAHLILQTFWPASVSSASMLSFWYTVLHHTRIQERNFYLIRDPESNELGPATHCLDAFFTLEVDEMKDRKRIRRNRRTKDRRRMLPRKRWRGQVKAKKLLAQA